MNEGNRMTGTWRLPPPPHWPQQGPEQGPQLGRTAAAYGPVAGGGALGPGQIASTALNAGLRFAMLAPRTPTIRATSDQHGTTFQPDTSRSRVFTIVLAVASAFFLGWMVLRLAGMPLPGLFTSRRHHTDSSRMPLMDAYLAGTFGLVLGWTALRLTRLWKKIHLTISPIGFNFTTPTLARAARWEDVADVIDFVPWYDPVEASARELPSVRNVVLVLRDRSVKVLRNPEIFAANPAAMFWMIRYYWLNPQARVELTNGVALNRLAREDFPFS